MEENNFIFCEKCYKANESTRTTCIKCGARLNKNNNVVNENDNTKNRTSNAVAFKFKLVVKIIKIIGYIGAVATAILLMTLEQFWSGIIAGVIIAIATWFSTLLFEAIAEGLQLLQDIKNKM